MHELLRQYAAERLDEWPAAGDAMRDRHCDYYCVALQGWAADLKGPRQQDAMTQIEDDVENARAAWDWAVAGGRVKRLEQALDGLCLYYVWVGRHDEGEAACRAAREKITPLASTAEELKTLARIWTTLATGETRSKDSAADWVLPRLPVDRRAVLVRARGLYLGHHEERWDDLRLLVRPHVDHVVEAIERLTSRRAGQRVALQPTTSLNTRT